MERVPVCPTSSCHYSITLISCACTDCNGLWERAPFFPLVLANGPCYYDNDDVLAFSRVSPSGLYRTNIKTTKKYVVPVRTAGCIGSALREHRL